MKRQSLNGNISFLCLQFILIFFFTLITLLIFLTFRATGIHIDENEYLQYAFLGNSIGDSQYTGKPPLFYATIVFLYKHLSVFFGHLKPISLYLISNFLAALSITYLLKKVILYTRVNHYRVLGDCVRNNEMGHLWTLLISILSSPLVLLNTSSLMMETPVIFCLIITISLCIELFNTSEQNISPIKWLGISLSTTLAMMFKPTALFAILSLAFAPFICQIRFLKIKLSQKISKLLPIVLIGSAIFGYILVKVHLKWIKMVVATHYATLDLILRKPDILMERLGWSSKYFWTWIFYLGPSLCVLFYFIQSKRKKGDIPSIIYVLSMASLICIPLTHLIQLSSTNDYIRYTYPLLFMGLICSLVGIYLLNPRGLILISMIQIFFSSSLIRVDSYRFLFWPKTVREEFFESSGTKFRDIPLFYLTTFINLQSTSPCIFINSNSEERRDKTVQIISFLLPRSQFVTWNELHSSVCSDRPKILHKNSHKISNDSVEEITGFQNCPIFLSTHDIKKELLYSSEHILKLSYFQEDAHTHSLNQVSCWYNKKAH